MMNGELSIAYTKALAAASAASGEFRKAQLAYRARQIGDKEFLAAKALHDKAQAEFDNAYAKEKGWH